MRLLLPVVLLFAVFRLSGAERFEISTTVESVHRWRGSFLYSGKKISGALVFKLSENNDSIFMFGFNTYFFSAGHLENAGLAAEVGNPKHDSFPRLVEKTRYRANLRSDSKSRIGVALMPLDSRIGVVWERQRDADKGVVWMVPVLTDSWNFEVLGLIAMLRSAISDDRWHPQKLQRAESSLGIISSRLRYSFSKTDTGMTTIVSGGANLRPGYLLSWSINTSDGPWGFHFRGIYSSAYFHSGEGKRLEVPIGGRFGLQLKPREGFRFSVGYKGGMERSFPQPRHFTDEGSVGLGWNFSELKFFLSSDWGYVFSKRNEEDVIQRIKLGIDWYRKPYSVGLSSAVKPYGGGYVEIRGRIPIMNLWTLGALIKLREAAGTLLLNFRIRGTWDTKDNQFVMMIHMRDLGRDWHRGPSTADDLVISLKWIRKLDKEK